VTIKEIVRRTGYSRGLARKVLRGERSDVFRVRESSLEVHLPWLDAQWAIGRRNGAELWRQLKQQGFRGCLRVVAEGPRGGDRQTRPTLAPSAALLRPEPSPRLANASRLSPRRLLMAEMAEAEKA